MAEIILDNKLFNNDSISYHLFSERFLRGQVIKIKKNEVLKSYKLTDQNLLIIILIGKIEIFINNNKGQTIKEFE